MDYDRYHEECCDCALENVEPPECNGHVAGPVTCSKFIEKSIHQKIDEHFANITEEQLDKNLIEAGIDIYQQKCSECNDVHERIAFCRECNSCLYKHSKSLNNTQYPLFKCTICGTVNFWD
jgi:hypothetical protein